MAASRKEAPPMRELPRLYLFKLSHFCEKARWACDRKGMTYETVTVLPGMHLVTMRRVAPRRTVPVWVEDGQVIQGSSEIIDYLEVRYPDAPLTPADPAARAEALRWEPVLDQELGKTARRVFYYHALQDRRFLASQYNHGGPAWGAWFYALALPLILRGVRSLYDVSPESAARDLTRIEAVFAQLDRHFAERPYLAGDRFSRADLTLAALAAPFVYPSGHPEESSWRRTPPAAWVEQTQRLRDSLTAERVREFYRLERKPRARSAFAASDGKG
jgi:glutathione S-transferase